MINLVSIGLIPLEMHTRKLINIARSCLPTSLLEIAANLHSLCGQALYYPINKIESVRTRLSYKIESVRTRLYHTLSEA